MERFEEHDRRVLLSAIGLGRSPFQRLGGAQSFCLGALGDKREEAHVTNRGSVRYQRQSCAPGTQKRVHWAMGNAGRL